MSMCCGLVALKPEAVEDLIHGDFGLLNDDSPNVVSVEKAWHGLHYLLTGSAGESNGPLGLFLDGGEPVGDDLGYGPARLYTPPEVAKLHAALAPITEVELWGRFDPEAMSAQGVYPDIWDEDEADLRDEYMTYYREAKALVARANARKMALVVTLS